MIYISIAIVLIILIIASIVLWKVLSKKKLNQNPSLTQSTLSQEKILISPYAKGKEGEKFIANLLASNQQKNEYILNTIKFKYNNINSCQIDHIVINSYGIWVIETKNMKGFIYGNAQDDKWTQVLGYGKNKNFFNNPIKQNARHIALLADYLNTQDIFHNIVVFLDEANLSNIAASGVYSAQYLNNAFTIPKTILLSNEEVEYYYKLLLHLQLKKSTAYKLNIAKPKSLLKLQQEKKQQNKHICPKCGGQIVLRNSKFGVFYGCSNYPNCNYMKNCTCPKCNGKLIIRQKNNKFLACSNYPNCNYTQKLH